MKLYEIAEAKFDLEQLLIDSGGEIDDEIFQQLEDNALDFEEKLAHCCYVVQNSTARVGAIRNEVERLTRLQRAAESCIVRLKAYMQMCLERGNRLHVALATFELRVQDSPPSVGIVPEILPSRFYRVIPERREVDKAALIDAWKAGEELPVGVEIIQQKHLRIR